MTDMQCCFPLEHTFDGINAKAAQYTRRTRVLKFRFNTVVYTTSIHTDTASTVFITSELADMSNNIIQRLIQFDNQYID